MNNLKPLNIPAHHNIDFPKLQTAIDRFGTASQQYAIRETKASKQREEIVAERLEACQALYDVILDELDKAYNTPF